MKKKDPAVSDDKSELKGPASTPDEKVTTALRREPPPPQVFKHDDIMAVDSAIAAVRSEGTRPNVEHVEVQAIARLVEWGHDPAWAVRAVRERLY